ncbi:hypothetical protein [Pectobacterium sp. A5351]|uniref:hypothetical protein n=1 Tax=Pectobacterium sp. A5351 TaxID=2914983 RepID=UPI00232D310B|nr:hypothetical protein [Pectobacterium sp. A5351]WCG82239.1 hypothetical protein O1Q74_15110 [Pectobacterium sp. A5351]
MDKIKEYFTKDIVVSLARALSHSQYFAVKIKNNEISWKNILLIYFGFLAISIFITNSTLELHVNGKTLNGLKFAFFQTMYIFIFSFVIRSITFIFKGTLSYEKTLKIFFIYGGVIYIIDSILMIFEIHLDKGGNKFIVFLVSCMACVWILFSYLAILKVNGINGKIKRTVAVLSLITSSFLLSNVTSVITPYFIILDN